MSFILFRKGENLTLKSGETLSYTELKNQGIKDHYARAIYLTIQKEGIDKDTLTTWIRELNNPKLRASRADKLNAIVLQNTDSGKTLAPLPETPSPAPKKTRTRKASKTKTFTLYSRSNHQEAEKRAKILGLIPQQLAGHKIPEGISKEALFVIAEEKLASSLITTGFWTTASS